MMDRYGMDTAAIREDVVGTPHTEEPPAVGAEEPDDFAVSQFAWHQSSIAYAIRKSNHDWGKNERRQDKKVSPAGRSMSVRYHKIIYEISFALIHFIIFRSFRPVTSTG